MDESTFRAANVGDELVDVLSQALAILPKWLNVEPSAIVTS